MRPFIKWAGGKTQLLNVIKLLMPESYGTYYEPFLGGGALLLDILPKVAYVNDINSELINVYNQIKSDPKAVGTFLGGLDMIHNNHADPKEFYTKIRTQYNNDLGAGTAEQAAKFIYLNKHCFNGLYRVNSKGEFNVPFNGKVTGLSCLTSQLEETAAAIRRYSFTAVDFEEVCRTAKAGDFVFFDSPYAPLTPTSFTDYTKEGFAYEDHVRLAALFKQLTARGVYCLLTNHNTELIRKLYADFKYVVVSVNRNINSDADNRSGEEVIILNYDTPNFDVVKKTYSQILEARKTAASVTAADEPVKETKPKQTRTRKKTAKPKTAAEPTTTETKLDETVTEPEFKPEENTTSSVAEEFAVADAETSAVSKEEDSDAAIE